MEFSWVGRVGLSYGVVTSKHFHCLVGAIVVAAGVLLTLAANQQAQAQAPSSVCGEVVGVTPLQELCLEKTVSPNPVTVGQPLTFTITETCPPDSCGGFSNIHIIDVLPSGVTFVSAEANQPPAPHPGYPAPTCTENAGTIDCSPFFLIGGMSG